MPTKPQALIIRLHEEDNVVVACQPIGAGTDIAAEGVTCQRAIPIGHKLACGPIEAGQPIIKYGQVIGLAGQDIPPGGHVHDHNCLMASFERSAVWGQSARGTQLITPSREFQGYRQADGRVGTRNYIGVLSTVNCAGSVARFIADEVNRRGLLDDYPQVDGIVPLVHATGCDTAGAGEEFDTLRRVMQGYLRHPNFAAIVLIGLGCEVMQISEITASLSPQDTPRAFSIQETGGTRKSVEAGVAWVKDILPMAAARRRQSIAVSELTLALQCGGSDSFSGITANPALGAAADLLVAQGGTAILAETPEIYGAEHLLINRAATAETGKALQERIAWWENYAKRNGDQINTNLSPGNRAGGLSTILEKSLGAAIKGGTTDLMGVYQYAAPINTRGFVFMDSPGYDPCSITGQVASGANMICFTTGRGSAFGCKPVPSIKIATNTPVFERMADDMDINCGPIADNTATVGDKGQEIFEEIIAVASGKQTKSEALGYGDSEFVPWHIGTVM